MKAADTASLPIVPDLSAAPNTTPTNGDRSSRQRRSCLVIAASLGISFCALAAIAYVVFLYLDRSDDRNKASSELRVSFVIGGTQKGGTTFLVSHSYK